MLSVNLMVAEYRRAQPRNLPSVPEAFGVLVSVDVLRNSISVERLQAPIAMITAVISLIRLSLNSHVDVDSCHIVKIITNSR